MFLDFYELKENPFNVTSDPDFLYLSHTHQEALNHLIYGINERKGFVALTGEVGSGKTTICKALLNQLGDDVQTSFILNPDLPDTQLLKAILNDFGLHTEEDDKLSLVNRLNEFLLNELSFGGNAVLILDESQNLRMSTLETIRLLSNLETQKEKLIQILLVGQPQLKEKLNSPSLLQLRQRLSVRYHVGPLNKREISTYIDHRLKVAGSDGKIVFLKESIEPIYRYSRGVPRLINLICDKSLLRAYAKESFTINKEDVKFAIHELENQLTLTR